MYYIYIPVDCQRQSDQKKTATKLPQSFCFKTYLLRLNTNLMMNTTMSAATSKMLAIIVTR